MGCPETEARFLTTLHGRARSYLVICSFGELQRCAAASVGGCWCDAEAPPSAVVGADIGAKRGRSRPTTGARWGCTGRRCVTSTAMCAVGSQRCALNWHRMGSKGSLSRADDVAMARCGRPMGWRTLEDQRLRFDGDFSGAHSLWCEPGFSPARACVRCSLEGRMAGCPATICR